MHTATEKYDLGEGTNPQQLFAEAFNAEIEEALKLDPNIDEWRVSGRATREWPDKETRAWWEHHGPKFVQAWMNWRAVYSSWTLAALPGDRPGVELEFKPTIGGHPVKMFIDRLFILPNGAACVVDIKTGVWEADALQLGLYAEGVHQATGVRPQLGAFWYARKGLSGLLDLSKYTPAYLGQLVSNFYKAIGAEIFTPAPSPMCKACSVRHACAAFGGAQASTYDTDYPLMITGETNE